jgi:hypothetical protein
MEMTSSRKHPVTGAAQTVWHLDEPVPFTDIEVCGFTAWVVESTATGPTVNANGTTARVTETLLFPGLQDGTLIGDQFHSHQHAILSALIADARRPGKWFVCDECRDGYEYPAPGAPNPDGADALHCSDSCRKSADDAFADAVEYGAVAV